MIRTSSNVRTSYSFCVSWFLISAWSMPLSYDLSKSYDFKWLFLLSVAENPDCQSDLEKCRNCFSQKFEIKYFDSKSEKKICLCRISVWWEDRGIWKSRLVTWFWILVALFRVLGGGYLILELDVRSSMT